MGWFALFFISFSVLVVGFYLAVGLTPRASFSVAALAAAGIGAGQLFLRHQGRPPKGRELWLLTGGSLAVVLVVAGLQTVGLIAWRGRGFESVEALATVIFTSVPLAIILVGALSIVVIAGGLLLLLYGPGVRLLAKRAP
ncbi:MAG: ABZJ_00895 family protein [Pseudomonadota bacterium]